MTDYTNLLERLAVSAGDQECLYADAKAAIEALQTRVAESEDTNKALRVRLGSELERANELVADLQAECSELRGMAGAMDILRSEMIDSGVIDINVPPMFFSESIIPRLLRLADMEKQEPVAWLDRSTEERPGDAVWLPDDLQGMSTRGLVPLYAAPPVAAPVRLTEEQAEKVDEAIREALGDAYDCLRVWNAWSYGTMGPDDFSQVAEDSDRVAEIRNAAAVALGFKLEGEQ